MRRSFLFAFVAVFAIQSILPTHASAQVGNALASAPSPELRSGDGLDTNQSKYQEEIQSFLKRMGYEDFSAQAQATLDSGRDLAPQTRQILETNRDRLAVISDSRDLISYFLGRVSDRRDDSRTRDRLNILTGRLLNFGLKGLPNDLPQNIKNIQKHDEREAEAERFIQNYIENAANQATLDLEADLLSVIYSAPEAEQLEHERDAQFSKEKERIHELVKRVITAHYSQLEVTQTRFLGRALALALVRDARLRKRPDLEDRLRQVVLDHGEVLDNYISENQTFIAGTLKGSGPRVEKLQFKSGDLLTAFNRAAESSGTGLKYYPQGWLNQLIQFLNFRLGFQSFKTWIPWENRIDSKRLRGLRLSWTEKIVAFAMSMPFFRRGQNMIGLVDVKSDRESGLKATWIYRNMSNDGLGGIQIEDPRNFMTPGMTDRVALSRLNSSEIEKLNRTRPFSDHIQFGKSAEAGFSVRITEAERTQLLTNANREGWIENQVAPRAIETMRSMMTGEAAVGFHWGTKVDKRLLSSGQAIVAAHLIGAGIEIQSSEDQVKVAASVNQHERSLAKSTRLVAPGSWTWDSTIAKTKEIEFDKMDPQARVIEFYGSTRPPIDVRIHAIAVAGAQRFNLNEQSLSYVVQWARSSAEYQNLMKRPPQRPFRKYDPQLNGAEEKAREAAPESKMSDSQMREFLYDLGFEDLSREIREARVRGETYNEATHLQQERNEKSYQAINAGRELAIYLMSRLQDRVNLPGGASQIATIASTLLSAQPQLPIKKFPPEVLSMPEGAAKDAAMDSYLTSILRVTMEEHTRNLVSEMIQVLHGDLVLKAFQNGSLNPRRQQEVLADSRKLYDLTATIVERMYMDFLTGQTRYAGRAFLGLIARQAELQKNENLIKETSTALQLRGLRYENFIGDQWVFENEARTGLNVVKVQTLTFVLNRLIDTLSAVIPWGAQPNIDLKQRAKKAGLIGNPVSALFPVKPEVVEKEGYGTIAKLKDQASYEMFRDGFSHIGFVVMKEGRNSKVKMSWIVDNYPHLLVDTDVEIKGAKHNAGGLRFVGLEQFYLASHHSRFMVADLDPKKFYSMAMEHIEKNGIPKTKEKLFPYEAVEMKVSPLGEPLLQEDSEVKKSPWEVESSQDVLNRLYAEKDPDVFWKKYRDLVVSGFREDIRKGMIFHWITPSGRYEKGGAYCSSTLSIISIKKTGLNPEFKPSRWITPVKLIDKTYQVAKKYNWSWMTENEGIKTVVTMAGMGIVAPSGLAAQEYVVRYDSVFAPAQDLSTRLKADFATQNFKSLNSRQFVDKAVESAERRRFTQNQMDPSEVRAVSIQIHHVIEVQMGTIGHSFNSMKEALESVHLSLNPVKPAGPVIQGPSPMSCSKVFAN